MAEKKMARGEERGKMKRLQSCLIKMNSPFEF